MNRMSDLLKFRELISLFVILLISANTTICSAQMAENPKRTVVEGFVNTFNKKLNKDDVWKHFSLIQQEMHDCPKIVAQGQVDTISGKFKIVCYLEQNEPFQLFFTESPITVDELYNINVPECFLVDIYLEPGDSLYIKKIDESLDCGNIGKGVNNNPYFGGDLNNEYWPARPIDFSKDYLHFWLIKLENKYQTQIVILDSLIKKDISSDYYTYLWKNYTYGFYYQKLRAITSFLDMESYNEPRKNKSVFKEAEQMQQWIFPELNSKNLLNDSFLNLDNYREFVDLYVSYRITIKEKVSFIGYQWEPKKVIFDIAYEVLPPKTKEYYLAYTMVQILGWPDKKEAIRPFYEDFKREFPNTNYSRVLTRAFNTRGDIAKGKPAPSFTLNDHSDKPVKLSSLKGKKIFLYFYKSDIHLGIFNKAVSVFPELQKVFIYTGTDTELYHNNVKIYPDAIHLFNPNWSSAKEYNVNTLILGDDAEVFLIDKDGKISDYFNSLDSEDSEYKLFKILYASERSSESSSNMVIILTLIIGIIIVSAGISWLAIRWRARIIRKREEKKRKLVEMELRGIRAQMNPHFMFNSLSSIQNLINQTKVQEANLYLSKFAELMRRILNNAEKSTIPLNDEIDAIRTYCELEQLRFDFNFTIEIDRKIDIYNTEIPGMLIQPYVENAIIHGINNLIDKKGELIITVAIQNNLLCCTIDDNGIGRKASEISKPHKTNNNNGFGLRLTNERLNLLNSQYKQAISVTITDKQKTNGEVEGTKVEICFPLGD